MGKTCGTTCLATLGQLRSSTRSWRATLRHLACTTLISAITGLSKTATVMSPVLADPHLAVARLDDIVIIDSRPHGMALRLHARVRVRLLRPILVKFRGDHRAELAGGEGRCRALSSRVCVCVCARQGGWLTRMCAGCQLCAGRPRQAGSPTSRQMWAQEERVRSQLGLGRHSVSLTPMLAADPTLAVPTRSAGSGRDPKSWSCGQHRRQETTIPSKAEPRDVMATALQRPSLARRTAGSTRAHRDGGRITIGQKCSMLVKFDHAKHDQHW